MPTFRCKCGGLVEFDPEEGDDDDEIVCPCCGFSTEARLLVPVIDERFDPEMDRR